MSSYWIHLEMNTTLISHPGPICSGFVWMLFLSLFAGVIVSYDTSYHYRHCYWQRL